MVSFYVECLNRCFCPCSLRSVVFLLTWSFSILLVYDYCSYLLLFFLLLTTIRLHGMILNSPTRRFLPGENLRSGGPAYMEDFYDESFYIRQSQKQDFGHEYKHL